MHCDTKGYLYSNDFVTSVKRPGRQVMLVERKDKSDVKVFLTDIYILGLADVYEILAIAPDVNAILAISNWNHYTGEAKNYCRQKNIALFTFKELLGAIHYDGKEFLDYPDSNRNKRTRTTRNK